MTNRTDGLDAAGLRAALYAAAMAEDNCDPVIAEAIRAYLDATRRSALVDAPAGETELARQLVNAFSIYTIEDDGGIRLSTGGHTVAHYGEHSPEGMALLKLEAHCRELRSALASPPPVAEVEAQPVGKWEIDQSTDSPILTYEKCSVIQDEQAYYVLGLVRADIASPRPAVSEAQPITDEMVGAAMACFGKGYVTRDNLRDALRAALSSVPGKGEPDAQCCSAVSPCSWQRHHGMDSVCPTCVAASPKPSDPSSPEGGR